MPTLRLSAPMRTVVTSAIIALGLNIVVGWTGLLNLGIAAFAALGAYAFGILTCEIYPFQVGFWWGVLLAGAVGAFAGWLLGAPTLRLRGDYLAIVTLGFGEIVQDGLKNLEAITKGTQGINPLPAPSLPGIEFSSETPVRWFYAYLAILAVVVFLCRNLEFSRLGRQWFAVREDELAARCMGIQPDKAKLKAFAIGAALAAVGGALIASQLSSTGEPANYDFQMSILALCIVIVGGIGSITGVMVGAIVMVGLNNVVLPIATQSLQNAGIGSTQNVLTSPDNYKFLLFGLALVLMMRYRPDGIIHSGKAVRK
ncbi:MAG: branched-chain amino acid ABC transporter permease [Planctomycetota bacterium]|jgi:branched-chain amino acid transport system permease protein|nr:MAG: branched-chain amino acid ABC transporter permease [Planctomycetota bacterium]